MKHQIRYDTDQTTIKYKDTRQAPRTCADEANEFIKMA